MEADPGSRASADGSDRHLVQQRGAAGALVSRSLR
jgi:hypothetical protein